MFLLRSVMGDTLRTQKIPRSPLEHYEHINRIIVCPVLECLQSISTLSVWAGSQFCHWGSGLQNFQLWSRSAACFGRWRSSQFAAASLPCRCPTDLQGSPEGKNYGANFAGISLAANEHYNCCLECRGITTLITSLDSGVKSILLHD